MRRAILAAPVALLVGLVACGGGGGGGGKSADAANDKAAAEKINLKQSDFPSGWTSKPHQTSPDDAAMNKRFFECLGGSDPTPRQTADVHSPDFTQGQVNQASSRVQFMRKDADTANDLAALQGSKTTDCIKTLVQEAAQKQLPSGTSVSGLTAEQLKVPTYREGTAAFRVSFTVAATGINVPIYADAVYFRAGRALVSLTTVNGGSPIDSDFEKSLARKLADRA